MSTNATNQTGQNGSGSARKDTAGHASVQASRKDIDYLTFVPVSENVVGETVLGPVTAYLDAGCLGPAGMGGCAREMGHGGDHMDERAFHAYIESSLVEVLEGVKALQAERDALQAKLLSGVLIPHDLFDLIEDYFAERQDIADGPNGQVPDKAMTMLNALREVR